MLPRVTRSLYVNCPMHGFIKVDRCFRCEHFIDALFRVRCFAFYEPHRRQIVVYCSKRRGFSGRQKLQSIALCYNCEFFKGYNLEKGYLVCTYLLSKALGREKHGKS